MYCSVQIKKASYLLKDQIRAFQNVMDLLKVVSLNYKFYAFVVSVVKSPRWFVSQGVWKFLFSVCFLLLQSFARNLFRVQRKLIQSYDNLQITGGSVVECLPTWVARVRFSVGAPGQRMHSNVRLPWLNDMVVGQVNPNVSGNRRKHANCCPMCL